MKQACQAVRSVPLGWCQAWEAALFRGDHRLRTFAHNSAASHEILAIREERGVVVAKVSPSSTGQVTVTLALPPRSLERHLPQIVRLARQQGPQFATWLRQPSRELFDILEHIGLILWPQGIQEIHFTVTPETGQVPCPHALTALLETGRLLELDPWLLLRLRGLTPDILRRRLDPTALAVSRPQPAPGDATAAASSMDTDRFWGNPRALRTYIPAHDPETAPGMPAMTMGAPPVDNAEDRRLLSHLLQALYTQGGKGTPDAGN